MRLPVTCGLLALILLAPSCQNADGIRLYGEAEGLTAPQIRRESPNPCAPITPLYSGYGNELCINHLQMIVETFNALGVFAGCPTSNDFTTLAEQIESQIQVFEDERKAAKAEMEATHLYAPYDKWLRSRVQTEERIKKFRSGFGRTMAMRTFCRTDLTEQEREVADRVSQLGLEATSNSIEILFTMTDPQREPNSGVRRRERPADPRWFFIPFPRGKLIGP